MDGKNHNWFILSEYLCLPFSYMSFVILEEIEKKGFESNQFDIEPFNYLFNKSTCFLDKNFAKENYAMLQFIL